MNYCSFVANKSSNYTHFFENGNGNEPLSTIHNSSTLFVLHDNDKTAGGAQPNVDIPRQEINEANENSSSNSNTSDNEGEYDPKNDEGMCSNSYDETEMPLLVDLRQFNYEYYQFLLHNGDWEVMKSQITHFFKAKNYHIRNRHILLDENESLTDSANSKLFAIMEGISVLFEDIEKYYTDPQNAKCKVITIMSDAVAYGHIYSGAYLREHFLQFINSKGYITMSRKPRDSHSNLNDIKIVEDDSDELVHEYILHEGFGDL